MQDLAFPRQARARSNTGAIRGLQALGRLKTGQMNKTETAYAQHLEARKAVGEIVWYRFEGVKLRLDLFVRTVVGWSMSSRIDSELVLNALFQLLKRERIRRRVYATREQARADIFDYIEMFYNSKRRHGHAGEMSPVEFERRHFLKTGTV